MHVELVDAYEENQSELIPVVVLEIQIIVDQVDHRRYQETIYK